MPGNSREPLRFGKADTTSTPAAAASAAAAADRSQRIAFTGGRSARPGPARRALGEIAGRPGRFGLLLELDAHGVEPRFRAGDRAAVLELEIARLLARARLQ